MNLEPNGTNASGTCGVNSSQLVLSNPTATLVFTFVNVSPPAERRGGGTRWLRR